MSPRRLAPHVIGLRRFQDHDPLLEHTDLIEPGDRAGEGGHRLGLLRFEVTGVDLLECLEQRRDRRLQAGRHEAVKALGGGFVLATLATGCEALLAQRRVVTEAIFTIPYYLDCAGLPVFACRLTEGH